MQRWLIDICNASEQEILNGLPLLINRNLKGQFVISGLPSGVLFVTDDTEKDEQPGRFSFGKDKTFFYVDINA